MKRLKIALIGAGFRGSQHLDTLAKLDDAFEIVAIAEHDIARGNIARGNYGIPVYTNPEKMFGELDIDVVDIVVPPDGHLALTALAASRGAHILVETPIAPTLPQADAMIDVCSASGVHLEIAENVWRFPNELLKNMAIEAGWIGDLINVQMFYRSGSYHGMSVLRRCFGTSPVRVLGHAKALKPRSDFDPQSFVEAVVPSNVWEVGIFDFPTGATAVYQFPARSERGNYWEIVGTEASFVESEFVPNGSDGCTSSIEAEMDGAIIVALTVENSSCLEWQNPYVHYGVEGAEGYALAAQFMSIHAAVTLGSAVMYSGLDGRGDQEMVIGVRESALHGGEAIEFPITDLTDYEDRLLKDHEQRYGADALDAGSDAWQRLYPRRVLDGMYVR